MSDLNEEELENEFAKVCVAIGDIGNYYGGLNVVEIGNKFYWSIENHDGYYDEEIPKSLFDELVKFNNKE